MAVVCNSGFSSSSRKRRISSTTLGSNKRQRTLPDWSGVHRDVLELVLARCSLVDAFSFRAVCRSWRSTAKDYMRCSLFGQYSPWLVLPPNRQAEDEFDDYCQDGGFSFLNLAEKSKKTHKTLVPKLPAKSCCVGSSHGWLIFLDKETGEIFILNPSAEAKVTLPSVSTLGSTVGLGDHWITKAVLTADPISSGFSDHGVVLMYECGLKLAFSWCGDSKWTHLSSSHDLWVCYSDITCSRDHIYAVDQDGSVDIWDFSSTAHSKKIDSLVIPNCFFETVVEFGEGLRDLYSSRFYIVESKGDLLLLMRCIANFVTGDGELVREEDLDGDGSSPELVCPYMTKNFYVYKRDLDQKRWIKMESLGENALILGGNHSVSLSAVDFPHCQENSIYFTDDFWERMDEHYMYGGHDMGVFKFADRSIKQLLIGD